MQAVSRGYQQEAVELLQQLVRNRCVNDGTGSSSEAANADDLLAVIDGCGADIEVFDAAPGRRSLMARLPGSDPDAPSLMLMAHTDVVPAHEERWTFDPFGAEIHDGFVYGRGTLDMLGHAATMALAFRDHARAGRRQDGDVVFLAVADEEALSTYGCGWLDRNRPDVLDVDWVITESGGMVSRGKGVQGEDLPPRLTVLAGEKGAVRIEISVHGEPGHGSMPYGRSSAIDAVGEVIRRLEQQSGEVIITEQWDRIVRNSFPAPAHAYLLDPARIEEGLPHLQGIVARTVHALTRMTITVATVTTNGSWNTPASAATIGVDVRTLPGQTSADVVDLLTSRLAGISAQIDIDIIAEATSTSSAPEGPLWELMQSAAQVQVPGVQLNPGMAPGVTDARFFRQRGATAFGFGLYSERLDPSWMAGMVHGDDERVDVESIMATRMLWDTTLSLHARHH